MSVTKKSNGNGLHTVKAEPQVLKLIKRGMRRGGHDAYVEDFCRIHEIAALDVAEGRLPIQTWNSMRGGYGNILRAIDQQFRARKMGLTPSNKKLMAP